jgi:hypothetical protein
MESVTALADTCPELVPLVEFLAGSTRSIVR